MTRVVPFTQAHIRRAVKAATRVMAENGATVKQIAGVTGHKSLREIERYTKAADQRKLARAGVDKMSTEVANGNQEKWLTPQKPK